MLSPPTGPPRVSQRVSGRITFSLAARNARAMKQLKPIKHCGTSWREGGQGRQNTQAAPSRQNVGVGLVWDGKGNPVVGCPLGCV
eukprot:2923304-Pyramimonas_sp.AAC.1